MIPANDFQRQWTDIGPELMKAFEAVGRSGWYVLGSEVRDFESALTRFWGLRHAVGVASGLDAIEIGLRLLGCGPGDRVLTSPISAFATVLAIVRTGATPVFADCDDEGLIGLEQCAEILRENDGIRFMVPVHLYGHSLDLDRLGALREQHGLSIVEDCAQSIGASWRESPTGSVGQMAATSFYPTKNLGAMGDGGALLTDDADLAASARVMRDYGQTAKYQHDVIGYNSRLDEIQAALLARVALPRLHEWTQRRREIARQYGAAIVNPRLRLPGFQLASQPVWHLFPIRVMEGSKRDLLQHLRARGVMAAEHYPTVLADQPALKGIALQAPLGLEKARAFCTSQVSLPIHPYLTFEEVAEVAMACNSWE
jgi:dTDP-3-amino-3,4,6-trideoxy-alpha-D-glucose transaminase